jgi:hypothetical protein
VPAAPRDPGASGARGYLLDAVVAVAIFVSMVGTAFHTNSPFFGPAYGAYVGFAAAGILLGTVLVPLRPGSVDRERALARALPLAASALCVAAVVALALAVMHVIFREGWQDQDYLDRYCDGTNQLRDRVRITRTRFAVTLAEFGIRTETR